MGKALCICDLKSCSAEMINRVISLLNEVPEELVLHFAYQIPENTTDIISAHDTIKQEANDKLNEFSNEISKKLDIKISLNIVLGSVKSTLRRILLLDKNIKYVIGPQNYGKKIVDSTFKKEFPKVSLVFTSEDKIEKIENYDLSKLENQKIQDKFSLEKIKKAMDTGHSIKIADHLQSLFNEAVNILIII